MEEHPAADRNGPGLNPGALLSVMVNNLNVCSKLKPNA